jgi:hypothetical protein
MNEDSENQAVEEIVAESQEAHTDQEGQGSDKEYNFGALREQVSNYKNENETLRSRLNELERAYYSGPQKANVEQPSDDDDLLTKGELRKLLEEKEMMIQKQMRETQTRTRYRDYDDVVTKDVFEDITRDFPELGQAIMSSKDPNLLAYAIAKNSEAYRKKASKKQQQRSDANQIYENSRKPGSITQGTTGGGGISKTNFFESMSPQQFEEHVAKVKRGGDWSG